MNILVVEDETRLAANIARMLGIESYKTSVANNGVEAEQLLHEGHFDLVVMDIMMSEQDGLTTLEHIRSDSTLKHENVPVLMLTALDQVEDKVAGLDRGADDYLAKPFKMDELLARVRSLLRRRESKVADVLVCDSLQLDRATKQVSRSGQNIKLSATEYRLLEFLLLNQGEIQSETTLLEHVWDQNYDGMSNVVAVYVRYLRNKVDKDFAGETPLVGTSRGLGYTISC